MKMKVVELLERSALLRPVFPSRQLGREAHAPALAFGRGCTALDRAMIYV